MIHCLYLKKRCTEGRYRSEHCLVLTVTLFLSFANLYQNVTHVDVLCPSCWSDPDSSIQILYLTVRRISKITLSLFSPNLDQNVTFANVLCPVNSLNTWQLLYGGLYRCKVTAGLTLLRFYTLWRPMESANSIQDRSLKLRNLGALRSICLGLHLPVKVFVSVRHKYKV